MWSFAYDDWGKKINKVEKNTERKKIYDNLHSGERNVYATSKDNANILDEVIKETKKTRSTTLKVWMNLKDRRFYE